MCKVNKIPLPLPLVSLPSPPPPNPPGVVVKKVTFLPNLVVGPGVRTPCTYPYPTIKPSRPTVRPGLASTHSSSRSYPFSVNMILPSVDSPLLEPLSHPCIPLPFHHAGTIFQSPLTHARPVTDFQLALLESRDDRFLSLHDFYPQFQSCRSMADVISLSCQLAPCAFDISKAQV